MCLNCWLFQKLAVRIPKPFTLLTTVEVASLTSQMYANFGCQTTNIKRSKHIVHLSLTFFDAMDTGYTSISPGLAPQHLQLLGLGLLHSV